MQLITSTQGELKRNSLALATNLDIQDWKRIGHQLNDCHDSIMFWIGDWIIYGKGAYGEKYVEAMDVFRDERGEAFYSAQTLRNAVYVCSRIELSSRNDNLSFTHHFAVAKFEDQADIKKWLARAEDGKWSVEQLRAEIKASEAGPEAQAVHSVKADFDSTIHMMVTWFDRQESLRDWTTDRLSAVREKLNEGLERLLPIKAAMDAEFEKRKLAA